MSVMLWHPVTRAIYGPVGEDAVPHYRQSGWLRADERAEHEARAAERAELEAAEAVPAGRQAAKAKTGPEEK